MGSTAFQSMQSRHTEEDVRVHLCDVSHRSRATKEFSLFCEGTSNPWGIAFDPLGSAFVSACVLSITCGI